MLYELFQYDARDVRSLDILNEQIADVALPIWKRLGIESIGFWPVLVGPRSPRLTAIVAWQDLAQRQNLWDQFAETREWQEALTAHAVNPLLKSASTILRPIPSSPIARHDNQPSRLAGGVFELRIMSVDDDRTLPQLAQWFADGGQAHMAKHGMFVVGIWETYIGTRPQVSYMLIFDNLAHRERAWSAFYTDPEWPALQEGLYPNGVSLIGDTESSLMKGTMFSNWR